MSNGKSVPKVLIIGGGFGGLAAARALADADVQVTLVDRTNHHLFQPLLYQVATAVLAATEIAETTRHVLRDQKNATVLLGEVASIDPQGGKVVLTDGDEIPFDHLIVAAGATHGYFGRDEWAQFAPGLKSLDDAMNIRRRLLLSFEKAERGTDAQEIEKLLTVAIVGAGPTGVELAGAIAEISRQTLPGEFRHIDPSKTRVFLLEGAPRVLGVYEPSLSARAKAQLEDLGVQVVTGAVVKEIDAEGLRYEHEGKSVRIETKNMIWAAGVKASPLGAELARSTGVSLDRAGRVAVAPDLSVPGFPNISVIGDLAAAGSYLASGEVKPVPGVSPAAAQMGRFAVRQLLRRLRGKETERFRYLDKGSLATIGRGAAVADVPFPIVGRVRFSGFFAWLFWLFVHVLFLAGFRNRVIVTIHWFWTFVTRSRPARIVTRGVDATGPRH